jgi:hypothetical protein
MSPDVMQANPAVAIDGDAPRKRDLKRIAIDEAKSFFWIFCYLFIVFGLFVLHEWVVLSQHHLSYRFYGFAIFNALILAKIILVAEGLHFGERFKAKPLVYPIVYKSTAFTVLLIATYIAEEIVVAMFHGKRLMEGMPDIGGGTIGGLLAVTTIMSFALIPFFAFREIGRALGEAELHALIFGPDNLPGTTW